MSEGRSARRQKQARSRPALPIYWSDRAVADLESIGDYIARDNPGAAERWVNRIIETAEKAAQAPLVGRRVPEMGRDDVRETYLRKYRIVYRIAAARLEVLTVFEGHRAFPADIQP